MKVGSIVGLTKELDARNVAILYKSGIVLQRDTPYVIQDGPKHKQWDNPKRVVIAVLLTEFPWEWLDASYFSELQPPEEVSIEEIVGSMVPAMVSACL